MCLAYVIVLMFLVGGVSINATLVRDSPKSEGDRVSIMASNRLPAPQAYWDMSSLRDNALQNFADPTRTTDGTVYGTTSSQGVVGNGLTFDGYGDAVEIPDSDNVLGSDDTGTVSAWMRLTAENPATRTLRVAFVILSYSEQPRTDADVTFLGQVRNEALTLFGEMTHGNGILDISATIFVQTPIHDTGDYPPYIHLEEVNQFHSLREAASESDMYDFICFFPTKDHGYGKHEVNFKELPGTGDPAMWFEVPIEGASPSSEYIKGCAVLTGSLYEPSSEGVAYEFLHEMSHVCCAWWHYYDSNGVLQRVPVTSTDHYQMALRTDENSANGGFGWNQNTDPDHTWSATASISPYYPLPPGTPDGEYTSADFNLDEYLFGFIPESVAHDVHYLTAEEGYSIVLNQCHATDTTIPTSQIVAAEGPANRQCIVAHCTDERGDVFRGQGWGLFVGTSAPDDCVYWYGGSADGDVEWRKGETRVGDGAWHQVTVSWNGATASLYVDGIADITWDITPVVTSDGVPTVIGCEKVADPYFLSWFSGSIDEVYLYHSALTAGQVGQLHAMGDLSGQVSNINSGLSYGTIQGAIDATQTRTADTLIVRAGTYTDEIMVGKSVSLVGAHHSAILLGDGVRTVALTVDASNVMISDFAVQGYTDICIWLSPTAGGAIVYNNYLSGPDSLIGILILGADGCSIRDNEISNQYEGIELSRYVRALPDNNVIEGNEIIGTYYGIWPSSGSGNVIRDNHLEFNHYGVYVTSSAQANSFYHNSFSGNVHSIFSSGSLVNIWDDGYSSGNYWSDYTGSDENQDGIGDAPYVINAYNQDRYPLMMPMP